MARSNPSATSGSSEPTRGETASRIPASDFEPDSSGAGRSRAVDERPPSGPAIAASTSAQSATDRAIGPAWSRLGDSGTMPRSET